MAAQEQWRSSIICGALNSTGFIASLHPLPSSRPSHLLFSSFPSERPKSHSYGLIVISNLIQAQLLPSLGSCLSIRPTRLEPSRGDLTDVKALHKNIPKARHILTQHLIMASSPYVGDVCAEDKQPRKKLDKGKGKMKLSPELPDELWRRILEFRYDAICEGEWRATRLFLSIPILSPAPRTPKQTLYESRLTLQQAGRQRDSWPTA